MSGLRREKQDSARLPAGWLMRHWLDIVKTEPRYLIQTSYEVSHNSTLPQSVQGFTQEVQRRAQELRMSECEDRKWLN